MAANIGCAPNPRHPHHPSFAFPTRTRRHTDLPGRSPQAALSAISSPVSPVLSVATFPAPRTRSISLANTSPVAVDALASALGGPRTRRAARGPRAPRHWALVRRGQCAIRGRELSARSG